MADNPLVLVTRTSPGGTRLTERLQEVGLDAVHCAPFDLEGPENPAEVAQDLRAALPADRVIITSQEGVKRSIELVGPAAFKRALVIVPGEGTAALARELGMETVVFPSRHGTSEAMLMMPELEEVDGLDVLILAAASGRSLMGQVLEERGALVEVIHVYRRVKQVLPTEIAGRVADAGNVVTLAASWESLNGLCRALDRTSVQRIRKGIVIAPSRRVAARAAQIGFEHCLTATGADDEAMIAELSRATSIPGLR